VFVYQLFVDVFIFEEIVPIERFLLTRLIMYQFLNGDLLFL